MLNPIVSTFGAPCDLLPVIHIATLELCVEQARSAFAEGANGVFAIDEIDAVIDGIGGEK